jgi:Sulfotransferase family
MEAPKANLFVVGAMKAGTTSFMDLLTQHPQIYVSPIKEPNYFIEELPKKLYEPSRFFNLEKYFQRDSPRPLHIAHVKKAADYQKLFSFQKGEKYLAEGSTMYLHAPKVAQRIREFNPAAKIIIITREPLKRSFSHYKMLMALSRESKNFQEVMDGEIKQYEMGDLPWYSYLSMSFYGKAISRYKSLFRDVCIISFEDLVSPRKTVIEKVASFLDIDGLDEIPSTYINPTRSLRFKKTFFLLKKIGIKDYFSVIFGGKLKKKIFRFASRSESEPMILSEETLQILERIFKKESRE